MVTAKRNVNNKKIQQEYLIKIIDNPSLHGLKNEQSRHFEKRVLFWQCSFFLLNYNCSVGITITNLLIKFERNNIFSEVWL